MFTFLLGVCFLGVIFEDVVDEKIDYFIMISSYLFVIFAISYNLVETNNLLSFRQMNNRESGDLLLKMLVLVTMPKNIFEA